ncbi:MAG: enoyl-CoA hydratase/isomerase family protein [Bacteroidia bacterium]
MTFENLIYTAEENIATIKINRPDKLNALNISTIKEIKQAIRAAENDESVKGIIITGEGSKAFVAGADIAEFSNFSAAEAKEMSENGHDTFNAVEHCEKPVIAAINGFALGGGCELAMSCHMRIAATNAKFGQPEVNLGLIPGYGGTQRLVRLIGRSKATELLLTGDMIGAEEAKTLGLVNHVVAPEELITKAKDILQKISKKSPLAIAQTLRLINHYYDKKDNGFAEEISEFSHCFDTEDFKEGVDAFLNKRAAQFTGK